MQLGGVSGCNLFASTFGFGSFTTFSNWRLIHSSARKLKKSKIISPPRRGGHSFVNNLVTIFSINSRMHFWRTEPTRDQGH